MANHMCEKFSWASRRGHNECIVALLTDGLSLTNIINEKDGYGWKNRLGIIIISV